MKRILIWDLPVRLFHWLLVAAFVGAFALATLTSDESPAFGLHMILGLIVAFMVALRVLWGFIGTRYARFRSFLFGPRAVARYLGGAVTGYAGHNPASAWAIFAMLGLLAATAFTGWQRLEDLHKVFAWTTAAVAAVHVLGVIIHVVRTRENLVGSMFTGRKATNVAAPIPSARPWSGVAFLLLTGWWATSLFAGYDRATRTLRIPITGATVQLGEDEHERPSAEEHEEED